MTNTYKITLLFKDKNNTIIGNMPISKQLTQRQLINRLRKYEKTFLNVGYDFIKSEVIYH